MKSEATFIIVPKKIPLMLSIYRLFIASLATEELPTSYAAENRGGLWKTDRRVGIILTDVQNRINNILGTHKIPIKTIIEETDISAILETVIDKQKQMASKIVKNLIHYYVTGIGFGEAERLSFARKDKRPNKSLRDHVKEISNK